MVGDRSGFLGPCKTVDEEGIVCEMEDADLEVLHPTEGLDSIEMLVADLAFADQIAFKAKVFA